MRLLEIGANDQLSLTNFISNKVPKYVILSHTWEADHDEVTYEDFTNNLGLNKKGYRKIHFCRDQAKKDDFQYFWIDSVCIDKKNSVELQEAINSMARWYRKAAKCYIYLSDVSSADEYDTFRRSRWFTRGWTLQELLAPATVEFYSQDRQYLGDRNSLQDRILKATRISAAALQGEPFTKFSIEDRLSWMAKRETTIDEDIVYCLLGIFEIHMPLIYGEGARNAFSRLFREIEIRSGPGKSTHALIK
jgi:hypothetical protein